MLEVDQEVNASAEQVGAGETVNQVRLDIRIGDGSSPQIINIGAVYTGTMHVHVSLDVGGDVE